MISLALPKRLFRSRKIICDPQSSAFQLVFGGRGNGEEDERLRIRAPILDRGNQMRAVGLPMPPIAQMHFGVKAMAFSAHQVGLSGEHSVISGKSLFVTLQLAEDIAAA